MPLFATGKRRVRSVQIRSHRGIGSYHPLVAEPVPHVDLRHPLDESAELVLREVRADAPKTGRDVVPRHGEGDSTLQFPSIHSTVTIASNVPFPFGAGGRQIAAMRVALLTISTAGSRGERKDTSGDAIAAWARDRKYELVARMLVSDDANAIIRQLLEWCDGDGADLVLTTGGTGLSPTDVTPEATAVAIERDAPGIAEWLRAKSVREFPKAALSRGRAGVRHRTLIVNLPGSPSGVKDSLAALDPIVDHAVAVLRGEAGDHGAK